MIDEVESGVCPVNRGREGIVMADAELEGFLSRVTEHLAGLSRGGFDSASWRFENRPTTEGVGLKSGLEIDVDKMVACIMNVEDYPDNVQYVDSIEVRNRVAEGDVNYVQRMKLPALGGMQVVLHLVDLGDRDGWRVVGWTQDDAATDELNPKKGGARTAYNLGAWLLKSDEVAYALSAAPVKKDVGTIKYALMTKGADATAGTVMKATIDGMTSWSQRV